jgi:hypothetical protein
MVAKFAGLNEVRDSEKGTEHDADAADDDVGDAEEGILTAHYGAG